MKNYIEILFSSGLKAKILETGAGVPLANYYLSHPGASKFIHTTECLYAKDAFNERYGVVDRAVSKQRLMSVLERPNNYSKYDISIATTFQIGSDISQHGWIGIDILGKKRYFHLSFYKMTRDEITTNIIDTVNDLLVNDLTITIPNNIDIIESTTESLLAETLHALSQNVGHDNENVSVIYRDRVDRIESFVRMNETINIYKGSFNPVTKAHFDIANHFDNPIFNICIENFEKSKGVVDIESLIHRINMIHLLGIPVLISSKPFFIDTNKAINTNKTINYILGADTFNRLADFYTKENNAGNIVKIEQYFKKLFCNTTFSVFNRKDHDLHSYAELDIVKVFETEIDDISSTLIRNSIEDDISSMLHNDVYEYIIANKLYGKIN